MIEDIIRAYLPEMRDFSVAPIGSGLIHRTWKVEVRGGKEAGDGAAGGDGAAYILQQVNTAVFTDPAAIAGNLGKIGRYLSAHYPDYLFVAPVWMVETTEGYFRLSPYIKGSRTFDVVESPAQAFEAARQFGLFTRNLAGFEAGELADTLPDFHHLSLRYAQFLQAVEEGNRERIGQSGELIRFLGEQRKLVEVYEFLKRDAGFSSRVTHHDTKISNVLFDGASDKGLCVIDLDTVMPGYFISDVGDMIRTYVSPASEEETDLEKVVVRADFYRAIYDGYMGEMGDVLSAVEKEHFFYSGLFMVYMQALRFLTDHLNDDVYYGARYAGHNYNRAANQAMLLRRLSDMRGAGKL